MQKGWHCNLGLHIGKHERVSQAENGISRIINALMMDRGKRRLAVNGNHGRANAQRRRAETRKGPGDRSPNFKLFSRRR